MTALTSMASRSRFSFEGAKAFLEVTQDGPEESNLCLQPQGYDSITGHLDFANDIEYQQGDRLFFALMEVNGGTASLLGTKCIDITDTKAQTYSFEHDLEELDPELTVVLMLRFYRQIGEDIYQPLAATAREVIVSEGQQVVPDVNFRLERQEQ